MARAAAKRNRSAGKAARPLTAEQKRPRKQKQETTLEDELFFTRLRGHAKWAFALLAVVFAGSFVFLGVGSGNAGLGRLFSNVFSGGSAHRSRLQEKVADVLATSRGSPISRRRSSETAVPQRPSPHAARLATRPKDEEVLAALALVFQTQAAAAYNELSLAARDISLADPGAQFRPGAGALGEALGSFTDPLGQAASTEAPGEVSGGDPQFSPRTRTLSTCTSSSRPCLLRTRQPSSAGRQAAESAGDFAAALNVYRTFVKRFPTDPLVVDARQKIKDAKLQLAAPEPQQALQEATPGSQG